MVTFRCFIFISDLTVVVDAELETISVTERFPFGGKDGTLSERCLALQDKIDLMMRDSEETFEVAVMGIVLGIHQEGRKFSITF